MADAPPGNPPGNPDLQKKVSVIGCDSFLALRNVRNGDLGRKLQALEVWVDPHQFEGSKSACPPGAAIDTLIDFNLQKDPVLAGLIGPAYEARKAYHDGATLWNERVVSLTRRHRDQPWRQIPSRLMAGVRFAKGWVQGSMGKARRGRMECARALRDHPQAGIYRRRFGKVGAQVVAGFSPEGLREMLLIEAANSFQLPTAVMIRSRDNLSAKIQHLPLAHRYLVWSQRTKAFLLKLYPEIDPGTVDVTGSPQFDRHLDPAFRLPREDFFARMRLNPDRPLIVYTMATPGLIDHEIEIVQHLADAAHAGRFARRAQLLVRGHPRMFGSDVMLLRREYEEARAYPPPTHARYNSPEHESEVVRLILEEEAIHLSTLACQDVQVNVCGTMTIDSAILDKPVVNVYYDLVPNIPSALSVRKFYERTDVREMMAYQASRLAYSPDDAIRLINQYLEDPGLDATGRARARQEDCGILDGRAGDRIAAVLRALAGEK